MMETKEAESNWGWGCNAKKVELVLWRLDGEKIFNRRRLVIWSGEFGIREELV